jgi:hypothetical protein
MELQQYGPVIGGILVILGTLGIGWKKGGKELFRAILKDRKESRDAAQKVLDAQLQERDRREKQWTELSQSMVGAMNRQETTSGHIITTLLTVNSTLEQPNRLVGGLYGQQGRPLPLPEPMQERVASNGSGS